MSDRKLYEIEFTEIDKIKDPDQAAKLEMELVNSTMRMNQLIDRVRQRRTYMKYGVKYGDEVEYVGKGGEIMEGKITGASTHFIVCVHRNKDGQWGSQRHYIYCDPKEVTVKRDAYEDFGYAQET